MTRWTADDVSSLVGRSALVTGANSGIGYETAKVLARHGARVLCTCRSPERGSAALGRLRDEVPGAAVELVPLDLADLSSVADAADAVASSLTELDILVNNAGVMAVPERMTTAQGFELQFGTNHLGHFALTGLLLPLLLHAPAGRVVTVSSLSHKRGVMNLEDLDSVLHYTAWGAYGQSKLANVLFFLELDRRLRAASAPALSVGAHPGIAVTNLAISGPRLAAAGRSRLRVLFENAVTAGGVRLIGQSAERGALPQLYAATAPDVESGQFFGPDGPGETRGAPRLRSVSAAGRNVEMARRLFERSVELTGVAFAELD